MDMILKTTDLCKNFKGQMAVNNVSLNIRRNSVYGLLRPNGAGKSKEKTSAQRQKRKKTAAGQTHFHA